MQYFRRCLAFGAIVALFGCSSGGQSSAPKTPGGSTAIAQYHYVHDVYKAPAGSRVYAVKHPMFRVERNGNVAFFPGDATFTKTSTGELLIKDSIDPAGVLIAHAETLKITPVTLDGSVVVRPGESLDRRFTNSAHLTEVLK